MIKVQYSYDDIMAFSPNHMCDDIFITHRQTNISNVYVHILIFPLPSGRIVSAVFSLLFDSIHFTIAHVRNP